MVGNGGFVEQQEKGFYRLSYKRVKSWTVASETPQFPK